MSLTFYMATSYVGKPEQGTLLICSETVQQSKIGPGKNSAMFAETILFCSRICRVIDTEYWYMKVQDKTLYKAFWLLKMHSTKPVILN